MKHGNHWQDIAIELLVPWQQGHRTEQRRRSDDGKKRRDGCLASQILKQRDALQRQRENKRDPPEGRGDADDRPESR